MKRLYSNGKTLILLVFTFVCFLNKQANAQIITTIAGNGTPTYNGDSIPLTQAQFAPQTLITDNKGNIFITDINDSRIRKIDVSGIISTVAGNGIRGFSGDSGLATNASLNYPWGIATDAAGNLYISDDGESRIRKVGTNGIITTIAGIDTVNGGGYNGDSILAIHARLLHPADIAMDSIGNLYIADQGSRIREIDKTGIITTIAGTGVYGYSGDGGLASHAEIQDPIGIAVDKKGNVYFTDFDNSRIRKIDTAGIITTIAGNGFEGYTGDGGPANLASLHKPADLAIAEDGTIFIADTYNNVIRKIDTLGIITTVIGTGEQGFSGDGGLARAAQLFYPSSIAFDRSGNLIFSDYGNYRIRSVMQAPLPSVLTIFKVNYFSAAVVIDWTVTTETNTAYYNVQRSKDGVLFTTIQKTISKNKGEAISNYTIADAEANKLNTQVLYYRLQSVDKDGRSSYSKVEMVVLKPQSAAFTLYPNPSNEILHIQIYNGRKEIVLIKLVDLQGRILRAEKVLLQQGTNNLAINISNLAKGSYLIKLAGEKTITRGFLKE